MTETKSVLIIDDEKDFVDALRSTLNYRGYNIITAYDGREGLEALEKHKPNFIILDITMPRMNGLEFLNKAMNDKGKMDVPTLVVSAREELRDILKEQDVLDFIVKPAKFEDIIRQVEHTLVRSSEPTEDYPQTLKTTWKMLWADDDDEFVEQAKPLFESVSYAVRHYKAGIGLLASAMGERPDIVMIKLGLEDMAGDDVAFEFRLVTESAPIPLILYSRQYDTLNHSVTQSLCKKLGIRDIFCFNEPQTLLKQANILLCRK